MEAVDGEAEETAPSPSKPGEDEYPPSPTLFYFAAKFLLGALTLLVFGIAYWFKPLLCEGTCAVLNESRECGPVAPKSLFYHHLDGGAEFIDLFRRLQTKKGYNIVELEGEYLEAMQNVPSLVAVHERVRTVLKQVPWDAALRANHTLYVGSLGAIDWVAVDLMDVDSFTMLRSPRHRLKDWYQEKVNAIPAEIMEKFTELKSPVSFEQCLVDERCRAAFRLKDQCETQFRAVCGYNCIGIIEDKKRLQQAKQALTQDFDFVGLFDLSEASASLLRRLYPTYFEFLPSEFTVAASAEAFSSASSSILDEICWLEDSLYEAAFNTLKLRGDKCGVSVELPSSFPRPSESYGFRLW